MSDHCDIVSLSLYETDVHKTVMEKLSNSKVAMSHAVPCNCGILTVWSACISGQCLRVLCAQD